MANYYFNQLDDQGKDSYNLLFEGINGFASQIVLPLTTKKNLQALYKAVLYDNPIIFYTKSYRYRHDVIKSFTFLYPIYDYPEAQANEAVELLTEFLRQFEVVRQTSDIEKELYVHDYCLQNFKYDRSFSDTAFSILGLIVFDTAVCEGIAKFVKFVLNFLGVECLLVTGKALTSLKRFRNSEAHMWNMVFIEGDPYHLDVTFDMTQSEKDKTKRYDYFNLSDAEIKIDHTIKCQVPTCEIIGNDYYSLNSQTFDSLSAVEEYIKEELAQEKNIIVFRLNVEEPFSALTGKIMERTKNAFLQKPDLGEQEISHEISLEIKSNPCLYIFELRLS
jgi:hypothetical protein